MKSLLDRDYKYDNAAKSREPNYLREKFRLIREQRNLPVSNVKPIIRVKTK